ncbi:MAG: HPP family protein [Pontibacterium sp.]
MALVMYDGGSRIQTPRSSVIKSNAPRVYSAKASHRNSGEEDMVDAQGHRYAQQQNRYNQEQTPTNEQQESLQLQTNRRLAAAYAETDRAVSAINDRRRLKVSHLMNSTVATITPSATMTYAFQKMQSLNIRHLVVVDNTGKLLGLLEERNLLIAGKDSSKQIETIYSKKVMAATPDSQVRGIAQAFVEHNINALPIVDETNKVVGMVTRTDLLKLLVGSASLSSTA